MMADLSHTELNSNYFPGIVGGVEVHARFYAVHRHTPKASTENQPLL